MFFPIFENTKDRIWNFLLTCLVWAVHLSRKVILKIFIQFRTCIKQYTYSLSKIVWKPLASYFPFAQIQTFVIFWYHIWFNNLALKNIFLSLVHLLNGFTNFKFQIPKFRIFINTYLELGMKLVICKIMWWSEQQFSFLLWYNSRSYKAFSNDITDNFGFMDFCF